MFSVHRINAHRLLVTSNLAQMAIGIALLMLVVAPTLHVVFFNRYMSKTFLESLLAAEMTTFGLLSLVLAWTAFFHTWRTDVDLREGTLVTSDATLFGTHYVQRPLATAIRVEIRRRPTLVVSRIRLCTHDGPVDLGPPGFLLPGQSAAAREIAEFLGVPLTDERGIVIPYRA
ncbi:hypothetical protein [Stappia sp.]|uniref:hypothetical protein n=1 Tax=Stappia sp. TaxID=1870903 RepID=UPI0032D940C9